MPDVLHDFWFLAFAAGAIVGVVGVVARAWQGIRTVQAETRLKQAMIDRGLSVAEMQALQQPPPLSDEQIVQKLGELLAEKEASKHTIERVMAVFNSSDARGKRILCHALIGLCETCDATDEQFGAVVDGLCRPAEGVRSEQLADDLSHRIRSIS
jgi:hypothetical protein